MTTITTDDNLATINDFHHELKEAGFTVPISKLSEMTPEQRQAMREWLDDENAVDIPEPFEQYVTEQQGEVDEVPEPNPLIAQQSVPEPDLEDAARKLREIRDAELAVCEAESVVDEAKDQLKDAKAHYDAAVLRLRGVIQSHSSPQKELPFRDDADPEANGAAMPPDPAGDEPLTVLVTQTLRRRLDRPEIDGLTARKVEIIGEACGGHRIADLERWFRENPNWDRDLPGFGEEWVTRLQDAHLAYRTAFPIPTEEPEEDPEAGNLDELTDILMLVRLEPTDQQIDQWSEAERQDAYRWCDAVHRASTGETVEIPSVPGCLADIVPDDMAADPVGFLGGGE